jgi:hypothetical protein
MNIPLAAARLQTTTSPARRLPASGNAALAASALIQAVLGLEFVLSGLNKFADLRFDQNFEAFVRASPGSQRGIFSGLIHALVLPNVGLWAFTIKWTELLLGVVLLVGAAEIARRRFPGSIGSPHGYEAIVALTAAVAGVTAAGLSLSIFLLEGGVLPEIQPGRAFTSAIPVELLITPLGLAIAWLEFGRYDVLKRPSR